MVTEQNKTLEALQIAIKMEIDGKKYYQKMSESSQNDTGQKLFLALAAEEDIHREKFEEIFASIQAGKGWPRMEIVIHNELKTLFSFTGNNIEATKSELNSIQIAMEMENKTYDFYKEQSKKSLFETEKKFYENLAAQERVHHSVLLDYFEYLKDPAGFFTMKERQSLDGG
jgi:rubrerythrin